MMPRRSLLPPGSSQRLPNGRQSARKAGPKPRKWRTNLRVLVRSVAAKEQARHQLRRRLMHRRKTTTTTTMTIRHSPRAVAHADAAPLSAEDWEGLLKVSGGPGPLLDAMEGLLAAALQKATRRC